MLPDSGTDPIAPVAPLGRSCREDLSAISQQGDSGCCVLSAQSSTRFRNATGLLRWRPVRNMDRERVVLSRCGNDYVFQTLARVMEREVGVYKKS